MPSATSVRQSNPAADSAARATPVPCGGVRDGAQAVRTHAAPTTRKRWIIGEGGAGEGASHAGSGTRSADTTAPGGAMLRWGDEALVRAIRIAFLRMTSTGTRSLPHARQ